MNLVLFKVILYSGQFPLTAIKVDALANELTLRGGGGRNGRRLALSSVTVT